MKRTKLEGLSGVFLTDEEFMQVEAELKSRASRIQALKSEVEKARGEQKYKLKKLSQIIERKDKQLAVLQSYR